MKKYLESFVREDEGVETIEFIGLVAVAAVLIGVVATIGGKMKNTANSAQGAMDGAIQQLGNEIGTPMT